MELMGNVRGVMGSARNVVVPLIMNALSVEQRIY